MAEQQFAAGSYLFSKDQPLNFLYLILNGSVEATGNYGTLTLTKGDVAGIIDIHHGMAQFEYKVTEPLTVTAIPFSGESNFPAIITALSSNARIFVASMAKQLCRVYEIYSRAFIECNTNYSLVKKHLTAYQKICEKYSLPMKELASADTLEPLSSELKIAPWLIDYYRNYDMLDPAAFNSHFSQNPSICAGFLMKAGIDASTAIRQLDALRVYSEEITPIFLDESCMDLYDLYASILLSKNGDAAVTEDVSDNFEELCFFLQENKSIDQTLYQKRSKEYEARLVALSGQNGSAADALDESLKEELDQSARKIIDYAGWPKDKRDVFCSAISQFGSCIDKTAQDDNSRSLRHQISDSFFELYKDVFFAACEEMNGKVDNFGKLPSYIRMFLLYGYMDADIAGAGNAAYLYKISELLPGDRSHGIYSFFEWLLAIYNGIKEPSRSEFDLDYADYLHEQKHNGKITAKEEAEQLQDPRGRVLYELNNAFPTICKVTSGRPSTFCPIFSEHNLFRDIEACHVKPKVMTQTLQLIRSIDFFAFYRESIYTGEGAQSFKFNAHTEILPDIILSPCVGTRGIMWQEIEGKRRNTPCRMFLPLFTGENVTQILIRLAGEYRWEMCKRIQGVHWNDVTDPSLTADYSDYLQFYRKNNELSPDAKEKVKLSLAKYRNSYKDHFVGDYLAWVMFEANGAPRLNKLSRRILFNYCPFSAPIRTKLSSNPLYKEPLDRYNIQVQQHLHLLENIQKKLVAAGQKVPEELESEILLWKR